MSAVAGSRLCLQDPDPAGRAANGQANSLRQPEVTNTFQEQLRQIHVMYTKIKRTLRVPSGLPNYTAESYCEMTLRKYMIHLYYGLIVRHHITKTCDGTILRKYITTKKNISDQIYSARRFRLLHPNPFVATHHPKDSSTPFCHVYYESDALFGPLVPGCRIGLSPMARPLVPIRIYMYINVYIYT